MKICFVCSEYPPGPHGGIGTMTQVLARALASRGHEVSSIGVYPPWYGSAGLAADSSVRILRLTERKPPFGWIGSRIELFRQISRWASEGRIDLVEVPDYQGFAAYWKPLPVPVIARLHGSLTYFASELKRPAERLPERLERASLRRVDFIASVCKYTARRTEEVLGVPMSSAEILYNPVEFSDCIETGVARQRYRVVFSGTLTPKKGIVSLIKAWPTVVRSVPHAELHVFGKDGRGPQGGSMQDFLGAMLNGERPSVHFHGHVGREKLFEAYRTAGAAVFPSYAEAFAVAPLESMAVGCPTIATRRGSGPELLDHESEGLLVDPDNPAEIAESILRVMRDESFAAKIGQQGSAKVRSTFTVDRLVAENEKFYERCIREFAARKN